jgi:hypothetical protein
MQYICATCHADVYQDENDRWDHWDDAQYPHPVIPTLNPNR